MKEQVITPRAGGGKGRGTEGGGGGVIAQRPIAKRGGGAGAAAATRQTRRQTWWRSASAHAPLALKSLIAVCLGLLIFAGYRAAASTSFFEAKDIDLDGTIRRASKDHLRQIVRRAVADSGVWDADLDAIRQQLQAQPWVRTAVVSRVLPAGLRARITEREPRVVVRTEAGKFVWVDDDGVMLGAVSSTDRVPAFFMRGWDERGSAAARAGNSERVARYVEIMREWEAAGLTARVSEVNLENLRDVRAQLAGDDSQIEVRLGGEELGKRLRQALKVLDEQRQTPRGAFITYVDLTQGTRAVIGSNVNLRVPTASDARGSGMPGGRDSGAVTNPAAAAAAATSGHRGSTDSGVREKRRDREVKKTIGRGGEAASGRNGGGGESGVAAERPRRVG